MLRGLGVEHRVVEQGLPHYVSVGHVPTWHARGVFTVCGWEVPEGRQGGDGLEGLAGFSGEGAVRQGLHARETEVEG